MISAIIKLLHTYINFLSFFEIAFPSLSNHSILIGCSPEATQTMLALFSMRTSTVLYLLLNFAGSDEMMMAQVSGVNCESDTFID